MYKAKNDTKSGGEAIITPWNGEANDLEILGISSHDPSVSIGTIIGRMERYGPTASGKMAGESVLDFGVPKHTHFRMSNARNIRKSHSTQLDCAWSFVQIQNHVSTIGSTKPMQFMHTCVHAVGVGCHHPVKLGGFGCAIGVVLFVHVCAPHLSWVKSSGCAKISKVICTFTHP